MIRTKGYHFILFLNIPKYSGGTNPWGNSSDQSFQPQTMNDGRIEVIGCYTSTLVWLFYLIISLWSLHLFSLLIKLNWIKNQAKFHIGGAGDRICQAKHVKLTTSTCIPIQIDGEPAKLCPSIIEIKHKNQAIMLEHVKNK